MARGKETGQALPMRHALLSAFLLSALTLAACGDSRRPPSNSPPVALADFCNEFVDAVCDATVRCTCSPTADADCRSDLAATCGSTGGFIGPEVQARITAGTVVYDAAAAGRLIGLVRAQSTCDNPILDTGWGIGEVLTFGGTVTGTRTPGMSCTPSSGSPFGGECQTGMCADTGRCIGFAGLGAPCGTGTDALCVDLDATFTSFESADILLRCNVAPGGTTGTCGARLAVGGTCGSTLDCASNRCEMGVCVAALANGDPCGSSDECDSGFCRFGTTTSVCAAAHAVNNGGACTDDAECVSGSCKADVCVPGICGVYDAPTPAPAPAP